MRTYTRTGERRGGGRTGGRALRERSGGRDLYSGVGPCAVIEGRELLMRKICANMCWIAGRDHAEPIEASSATAIEQENVFWEACRGRRTFDLVECVDGNASRVERLRLERGKSHCGSGETCEDQEGLHVG